MGPTFPFTTDINGYFKLDKSTYQYLGQQVTEESVQAVPPVSPSKEINMNTQLLLIEEGL